MVEVRGGGRSDVSDWSGWVLEAMLAMLLVHQGAAAAANRWRVRGCISCILYIVSVRMLHIVFRRCDSTIAVLTAGDPR